jgi:hypothetical protein
VLESTGALTAASTLALDNTNTLEKFVIGETQKRLRHLSAMLPVWILIFADDCHIRRHD